MQYGELYVSVATSLCKFIHCCIIILIWLYMLLFYYVTLLHFLASYVICLHSVMLSAVTLDNYFLLFSCIRGWCNHSGNRLVYIYFKYVCFVFTYLI